ncbi:hypothetical protein ABN028_32380 [Actinopolymorpha sp. B17G11]|uniref:hypothetical protein n=1 Tax=unclassified Actinopolymorpha TaxID=2627063 RepID=UPI0032D90213
MTVKLGISLPDDTHARAAAHAKRAGTSLSRWIDEALRVELARRDAAEHVAMLESSDDPQTLRRRATARRDALTTWKQSSR